MKPVRVLALLAFVLGIAAIAPIANAADTGFDSRYFGESAFVTLVPGQINQFAVGFTNTGRLGWQRDTFSQVNLGTCGATQQTSTCQMNVAPVNSSWKRDWLSSTAYATTTTTYVGPGQIGWFSFSVNAPPTASAGDYDFPGDLVLAITGQSLHREGYYQRVTITAFGAVGAPVPAPAPNPTPTPTPTPGPLSPWAYACGHTTFGNPATATDTPDTGGCPATDTAGTATAALAEGTLTLTKAGPTTDDLAAGATVNGINRVSNASFDVTGYCGAGSPRLNVVTSSGTHFYGCAANNSGGHVRIDFANAASDGSGLGGVGPTEPVTSINFVQDEMGSTTISNIVFNAAPAPKPTGFTLEPWQYACGHSQYANPGTVTDTPGANGCPATDVTGTATSSSDTPSKSLTMSKIGPTSDDLSAGATVCGHTTRCPEAVVGASYDVVGYCGAGSPRINVLTHDGKYHFYGCAANMTGGHVSITFANASQDGSGLGGVQPTDVVDEVDFVQDETGSSTLTNIVFAD